MSSAVPAFARANPGQKPARYTADVDGLSYCIAAESVSEDRWALSVDGEPLAEYRAFSSAVWAARADLEDRREAAAATTVAEFSRPDDGSVLSVFTNGYTKLTEVILDDTEGRHRLVLDRQQVEQLARALATVDESQQQARRRPAPA